MFVISGTPKGCTGIVFKDRAELEEVIEGLNRLKDDEIFIDRPIVYCQFPGEINSDEITEVYRSLREMVETKPWEVDKESG